MGFKFFILKTKNMKKYLLLLLSLFLIGSVSITQIEDGDDPYIMVWSIASDEGINLKVTGGTPYTGQNLSPTVNESINAGYPYKYVLFSSLDVEIWTGASGGGQLLGSTTINMVTTKPIDGKNGGGISVRAMHHSSVETGDDYTPEVDLVFLRKVTKLDIPTTSTAHFNLSL